MRFKQYLSEGLVHPPPKMVKSILNWALELRDDNKGKVNLSPTKIKKEIQTLKSKILSMAIAKQPETAINLLMSVIKDLEKQLKSKVKIWSRKKKEFKIDLSNLNNKKVIEKMPKYKEAMAFYDKITVTLVSKQAKTSGGSWDEKNKTLTIYGVSGDTESFLKVAINHELIHVTQSIMTMASGNIGSGKPSKKISSKIIKQNVGGYVNLKRALEKANKKDVKKILGDKPDIKSFIKTTKSTDGGIHALDDVEFYTRVHDMFIYLQQKTDWNNTENPRERINILKDFIKTPYANSLSVWSKISMGKYKKALKILTALA